MNGYVIDNRIIYMSSSILTGGYSDHTVTVMGYYEYDVASFLAVKDGWVTVTRYIHYEELSAVKGLTTIDV